MPHHILKNYSVKQYDDTIYIVGFWDTRMDDENQASQVK